MIVCGDKKNLDFSWGLRVDNSVARFFVRAGGYKWATGPSLSSGQWYHVVGVWDRNGGTNNLRIYVDGQLKGTSTVNANMDASTVNVCIGRVYYPAVNQYFKGLIDDVRIYKRVLSAGEIAALYEEVNRPPTARAGADQTVIDTDENGSEQVTLDGSDSNDPDGTILSWVWSDNLGDQISDGEIVTATLGVGTHTITLTVTDNEGATDTDTVIITVAPPSSFLVGHWSFDNPSDCGHDDSGNGNHAIIYGGATCDGGSLKLDGMDDYADCGSGDSLQEKSTLTVSAWINGSDFTNPYKPFNMIVCGDKKNLDFSWGLRVDNSVARFFVRAGGYKWATGPSLSSGQWYHVVGVWDGNGRENNLKIYVEGQLEGQTTVYANMDATIVNVCIGRVYYPVVNQYFKGLIDDVRIYNKALSATEVQALYDEVYGPDLIPPTPDPMT